jgi:hypothetical protein
MREARTMVAARRALSTRDSGGNRRNSRLDDREYSRPST